MSCNSCSQARPSGLGWMAPARARSIPSTPASCMRRKASMTTSCRLLCPPLKNRPTRQDGPALGPGESPGRLPDQEACGGMSRIGGASNP